MNAWAPDLSISRKSLGGPLYWCASVSDSYCYRYYKPVWHIVLCHIYYHCSPAIVHLYTIVRFKLTICHDISFPIFLPVFSRVASLAVRDFTYICWLCIFLFTSISLYRMHTECTLEMVQPSCRRESSATINQFTKNQRACTRNNFSLVYGLTRGKYFSGVSLFWILCFKNSRDLGPDLYGFGVSVLRKASIICGVILPCLCPVFLCVFRRASQACNKFHSKFFSSWCLTQTLWIIYFTLIFSYFSWKIKLSGFFPHKISYFYSVEKNK